MNRLRITPIGTCRIHTPLKRGSLRYPIELDLSRNYGFVHSAAEALQLIRFMQGELDIPQSVAPLVTRQGDLSEFRAQSWTPADLHVVEISSSKKLTCGDYVVQMNYLYRHFDDFFANSERSRTFWALVRKGHRGEVADFAHAQPAFQLLSEQERELLLSVTYEQQSFKAIKSEMGEIVERLGNDRLIFVTHVNAKTPDDEVIAGRDRLIRWVKLASEQLDVKAFDPTPAMTTVGQEVALEDGGLDLTHYTSAFSDIVYDEIHQFHIAEQIGSAIGGEAAESADAQLQGAASHLETMLQIGDFFRTSKEVHAAVERSPDAVPLIEVRGLVRARIGDYPGAVADLTRRDDQQALSQPMRVALLTALTATGQYRQALDVASAILNDEYENAEVYSAASEAAERLGNQEEALQYAKKAFRLSRSDLSVALRALRLLSQQGKPERIAEWRREIMESASTSSSGAFELCQWAIENRDDELFAAALPAVATADKGATIDLAEDAFRAGMYAAVAEAIPVLAAIGRLAPALAKRRQALLDELRDKASILFTDGDGRTAYRCAKALADLEAVPPGQLRTDRIALDAKRLIRSWVVDARTTIREAADKSGPEEVARIADNYGDLSAADTATAIAVARAFHALGRTEYGLSILKRVDGEQAQGHTYRRWTGRMAANAFDYGTALDMYGALQDDPTVPPKLRAEVDRFFASARSRAVRQLRSLVMADRFNEALALATSIMKRTGEVERVERELARMFRRLRGILLEIEQGEGDSTDRERILQLIVRIRPNDQSMLRRLALELMRQFRFAEAAEIWSRIRVIAPDNESAIRNLDRCEILARRRSGAPIAA